MKNVIIVGATGFGGLGLIEILIKHPYFNIKQLIARKDTGVEISKIFPHLTGYCNLTVDSYNDIKFDNIDIAFFSTPDRVGMTIIEDFFNKNIPVIDFSGDFRFNSVDDYKIYANNKNMNEEHLNPAVLNNTIYGLPEKFKNEIANSKIVGNPGCFAISMILGLLPVIEEGLVTADTIFCDGKTGVSGAGKNSGESNLYPQRHENVNSYREGNHQHLVEVENIINASSKTTKKILFIPQIVPLNRGILMTIYSDIKKNYNADKLMELYRNYYKDDPFVQITDNSPNTAEVRGSNYCKIKPGIDNRTGKLFIVSVIDNLIKGQSGNAVQNANIIMGFDQTTGIDTPAFYP